MKMSIKWRNDGDSAFEHERIVDFPTNLEHTLINLSQLGIYRTRQYEIVITDVDQSVGFVAIEEDVEFLAT